ncbi:MAG: chemotaxis response regulator protein-glutamate methylesterase [Anaerolineales bacterium]|nr:chemotaxis response regulator protein-glutamate methylesterase [Anaerolineales bacterium]
MSGGDVLPEKSNAGPIRTLIVDDSAYLRFTLRKYLAADPGIEIVGTARNGLEALNQIERLNPDVLTLDVEMPVMDGLTTLNKIMSISPRPVVMLSSLTKEGARETIRALTLGAVDFVTKPTSKTEIEAIMDDVIAKVKMAAGARVKTSGAAVRISEQIEEVAAAGKYPTRELESTDPVVCIGTSTGGPRALNALIPSLSATLQAALVIVQHMPVGFTKSLAERLDHLSALHVKEASQGDSLLVGQALLAPGGSHLEFRNSGLVNLTMGPTVHGVRPAVDVTLSSLASYFGNRCIAVIMTGMGRDGTNGSALIHSAGGKVIAEDQSTCVVWGMPRSVMEAGLPDEVVGLKEMAAALESSVRAFHHNQGQSTGIPG